jgi:hypothetical protein
VEGLGAPPSVAEAHVPTPVMAHAPRHGTAPWRGVAELVNGGRGEGRRAVMAVGAQRQREA